MQPFVPFEMERWQSTFENRVDYNLSESGVHPLRVEELAETDDDGAVLMATPTATASPVSPVSPVSPETAGPPMAEATMLMAVTQPASAVVMFSTGRAAVRANIAAFTTRASERSWTNSPPNRAAKPIR